MRAIGAFLLGLLAACSGSVANETGTSSGSVAANGVTGIKPTWGRVSRYGVFELAATLDHIGPMARSAGFATGDFR